MLQRKNRRRHRERRKCARPYRLKMFPRAEADEPVNLAQFDRQEYKRRNDSAGAERLETVRR